MLTNTCFLLCVFIRQALHGRDSLINTSIYEWHVVRCGSKNGHH